MYLLKLKTDTNKILAVEDLNPPQELRKNRDMKDNVRNTICTPKVTKEGRKEEWGENGRSAW